MVFELLDRDHAFVADFFHRSGDEFTNGRIVVGRDGRHLRLLLALSHGPRHCLERVDCCLRGAVETPLEIDRACSGHDIAHAIRQDGVSKYGGCARPIADAVAGLLGGLSQHLRPEIFFWILEAEFLGDRHPIIADDWYTPRLLDQYRLRLGT